LLSNNNPELDNLSKKQLLALQFIEEGKNIFVSGGAGSGKSYLLNFLKRHYSNYGLEVTASTGIASINIKGSTIHSWAGIGLANVPLRQIIANLESPKMSRVRSRIRKTKILAIDEISMISAEVLEILNEVFQAVRGNNKVMGGMQIIFFGDFLQLPPVNKFASKFNFCFNSKIWLDLNLKTIILDKIFRQQDQEFIDMLHDLRFGKVNEDTYRKLLSRVDAKDNNSLIRPTILTTHNSKVEMVNEEYLKKIPNKEFVYEASYQGNPQKIEFLKKNCLAPNFLKLKIGAQVMMIKNTYQKDGIINGSLGIVKGFSSKKQYPIVEFANAKEITIGQEQWNIEKFDEEGNIAVLEASMTQIPLILAWAMTIHKSQGLTLDKISCDLSDIFSCGQAYVALSRARSLDGVFINSIDFNKINANEEAINFYRSLTAITE